MALETRNVFLDTSVIKSKNYDFNGKILSHLSEASQEGIIKLFITSITNSEIKSNISEDIDASLKLWKKFRQEAKVLRNINTTEITALFANPTNQDIKQKLEGDFINFIQHAKVSEIAIDNPTIVKEVFDLYFSQLAPFGPGKKKNEFPDAFVLKSLDWWCTTNKEKMYVISKDEDMTKYQSESLIPVNSLEKFFDLLAREDEFLHMSIIKMLKANAPMIQEDISNSFRDLGFLLEDQDGDVDDVDVESIEINEYLVVSAEKDNADISVDVIIRYSAEISYMDMETAIYDKEEGQYVFWETISDTIDRQVEVPVRMYIEFDKNDANSLEVVELIVNNNQDISVTAVECDYR